MPVPFSEINPWDHYASSAMTAMIINSGYRGAYLSYEKCKELSKAAANIADCLLEIRPED